MAIRERGAGWQADVAWNKQRARGQFATEALARKWHDEALACMKAGKPIPAAKDEGGASDTIKGILDTIIATDWGRKRGCASVILLAKRYVNFVGPLLHPASALGQSKVDDFVTDLVEERRVSGATVNRHLSAISKMMKKALALGLIPRKLELPWQEEGEARLRWFTEDEDALIVQTFRLWARPLHADFFACLVDTGARTWTEMKRLRWEDVSKQPRMVTFWDTKNGDSRSVPLTNRAWAAIERQRDRPGAEEGPFRDLCKDDSRRLWDRLRVHSPSLKDAVWYTARHTFASRLVQRGVDLYRVQKLMGHRSIEMTMRYAKLAPTQLIDAIGVLEPTAPVVVPVPPLGHNGGPPLDDIDPKILALAIRLAKEMRQMEDA